MAAVLHMKYSSNSALITAVLHVKYSGNLALITRVFRPKYWDGGIRKALAGWEKEKNNLLLDINLYYYINDNK